MQDSDTSPKNTVYIKGYLRNIDKPFLCQNRPTSPTAVDAAASGSPPPAAGWRTRRGSNSGSCQGTKKSLEFPKYRYIYLLNTIFRQSKVHAANSGGGGGNSNGNNSGSSTSASASSSSKGELFVILNFMNEDLGIRNLLLANWYIQKIPPLRHCLIWASQ